jgi:phage terminase large subunit-like protein
VSGEAAITREWVHGPADELAVREGCWFDLGAANKACEFFPRILRHSKAPFAGKPFELAEWQRREIVMPLYGWRRKDGRRRFQRAYGEVPKKNGKSTLCAGIGIRELLGEDGAEVYSAACTKDQASVVHKQAIEMVGASDALADILRINRATREIFYDAKNGRYKALPADAHNAQGLNISACIYDELHAWKGVAGRAFYDSLRYGGRARANPLHFIITTAGDDVNGICYDVYKYAKDVASGEAKDTRFLSRIFEAQPTDDFDDPAVWHKANPSLGVTIQEDDFAADLREARRTPTAWSEFLRYSFNVWTQGGVSAFRREQWEACRGSYAESDLLRRECYAALDLARTRDFTAFSLVFPMGKGRYRVLAWVWLPQKVLDLPGTEARFREWAKAGFIRPTEGDVTDYDQVENDICEILAKFECQELAFDPILAEEITQRISVRAGVKRVAFSQGILNYAAPCAEFERVVIGRLIEHDGNPCLAWQVGNLTWKTDPAGNKRPDKARAKNKIDSPVTIIMALGRAMLKADDEACWTVGVM